MKNLIYVGIVIIIYMIIGNVSAVVIPDSAIRIRVIANSNSDYDQTIKNKVKKELETKMSLLLKDTNDINEARTIINNNLNSIDKSISKLLTKNKYPFTHEINFGMNFFPEKEFQGLKYDAGYYESLVVTLGAGEGDNWWCVLFPPLCLLEAEESSEVEYTTMVKELLNKYSLN